MARANATRPFMGRVVLMMCLEFTMEPLEELVLSGAGLEIDWGGL